MNIRILMAILSLGVINIAIADSKDIAGIALRSSAADAKTMLKKVNPNYTIEELKTPDGKLAGYRASFAIGEGTSALQQKFKIIADQMDILLSNNLVWYIRRVQNYPDGARPTGDATTKALIEKYGQNVPLGKGQFRGATSYWSMDRQGKHTNPDICNEANAQTGQVGEPLSFSQTCGYSVIVQTDTKSVYLNCPSTQCKYDRAEFGKKESVAARLSPTEAEKLVLAESQMIGRLEVKMYDSSLQYDALNRETTTKKNAEAAGIEREKARAVKPQL